MNALIDAAFARSRVVLLAFLMIFAVGAAAYTAIPKESSPEVKIPLAMVSVSLEGISPEDAVSSLLKPLETELGSIDGLAEMTTRASEGGGSITLEFDAGFDADTAIEDVRRAVDMAKPDLPEDATEPVVREINTALFPIMTVILSGSVPERALVQIADELADGIESIPGVLEVDIGGEREEMVEIIVDPQAFQTYGLTFADIAAAVSANNRLVAAGALSSGDGRLVMKLPGLIETADQVLDLPIKVTDTGTVRFKDVAEVRRTFADAEGYARIDGQPAIALEIKKQVGANILETTEAVQAVLDAAEDRFPTGVQASITQDESKQVRTLLGDLENNVIAAVLLVIIVILAVLGPRSSLLVGLSIPGSFLAGIAALWFSGFTMNIVVLFGLILVTGMLVDGAIVVIEYADRRTREGAAPRAAFQEAAKRMSWPIISSTATTLSVFLPLLFWQGTIGEFMKFLPITVLLTLTASLFMALVFIPVIGGAISRKPGSTGAEPDADPRDAHGPMRAYIRTLEAAILRPKTTLAFMGCGLMAIVIAYGQLGAGIEFFPKAEPDYARVQVLSRDNLSADGRDRLLREVESAIGTHPNIRSVYARSSAGSSRDGEDQIGSIQLEFTEWDVRPKASAIMEDLRGRLADIPGLRISVAVQEQGPAGSKPIELEIAGGSVEDRSAAIDAIRERMSALGGLTDIEDTRALPGIDYQIRVDRDEAARYGADLATIGQAVRLLTSGVKVSEYRPRDRDESVEIRVRFPGDDRTLDDVQNLRIPTARGMVPIGTFVDMSPVARSGSLMRIDGTTVDRIEADVAPGVLANDKAVALASWLETADLPGVDVSLKGEAEDQQDAMQFLALAFLAAIVLMLMILVAQFNSLLQAGLVLSAIVLSVAGVFLGLMITGRPFGVVMGGIGIIALAGIVVNNNIVLIDAYNEKRGEGRLPLEAALMTGAERLRPVLLTSFTTVLGLIPMTLALSIDIPGREIAVGAPSTLWWVDLSTSIAGGLAFATVLTLLVTPACLVLIDRRDRKIELGEEHLRTRLLRWWRRRRAPRQQGGAKQESLAS